MRFELLRRNSKGPLVLAWEEFLRDEQHYLIEVDGVFDPNTVEATKAFQEAHGLDVDGWVGNQTWGEAIKLGFHVLEDPDEDMLGPQWPPAPDFDPPRYATREEYFGHIEYRVNPTSSNPEAVEITNDFAKHIVSVEVPQLHGIPGVRWRGKLVGMGPLSGKLLMHERVADPMQQLWQRWEDEGLVGKVLTWGGMWAPRFVRGSRSVLSNHAYGTAFDINVPWNGLRKTPALVGMRGSVRELVPIANELGWWWGGHFTRKDGMHFEYAKR